MSLGNAQSLEGLGKLVRVHSFLYEYRTAIISFQKPNQRGCVPMILVATDMQATAEDRGCNMMGDGRCMRWEM